MTLVTSRQIKSSYHTANLWISDAKESDSEELQKVYDSVRYLLDWEGKTKEYDSSFMKNLLAHPDYPPNGHRDNLRIQTIRERNSQEVVGVLEIYHGYPNKNIFWVSMLQIKKEYQKLGYGQEVMNHLIEQVEQLNLFSSMQCAVYLKNWPGIRFWTKLGFNRIVKYYGAAEYSSDDFAAVMLRRDF